ncbi:uncharacterized protein METZ01_LOCUS382069 [marine metagenome]|uniref:Uncharacterized protein n=1 Tax=marine metagenome TaxID=408172 RepID=A0A382U5N6_9ZZZZ
MELESTQDYYLETIGLVSFWPT